MKPIKLIINTSSETYPIIIGSNLIRNLSKIFQDNSLNSKKYFLLIDKNVPKKLVSLISKSLKKRETIKYLFNSSEKNKNQKNINKILEILLKQNFSRQDCLISVGGGITGDVGGFASSLFKRGLKFIIIPTTLLSQVDSSIGGKTGVNTKQGKNLIGSFYQPKLVISDIDFLKSLPKREIICGYAEILKHSLIMNKKFYNFLNRNISNILGLKSPYIEKAIYQSCKIKKYIVEKDEKENGKRKVLNFGHTFAHAYEGTLNYSKKLNHGEAVILGMISALKFSLKNKYIKKNNYVSVINHFNQLKISLKISDYFSLKNLKTIISFMNKDKKNYSNKINLILLKKIGVTLNDNYYSSKKIEKFLKNELTY